MPVETCLPFWTPVLTSTTAEETEDFSGGCSWIIEKYFYWGSQAASCNALNDREVQLIPMPHQHSSLAAEVFFSVFTVLSYLTIIVPIIMAIAKCVLRCGKDYVITNPHAGLSEPNIPASMSTGEPLSIADMFRLQMQMTQRAQENEARQTMERLLLERRQAALRGVITAVRGL